LKIGDLHNVRIAVTSPKGLLCIIFIWKWCLNSEIFVVLKTKGLYSEWTACWLSLGCSQYRDIY